jgi:hypothetical protein
VAEKVALVSPAPIFTFAGTVKFAFVLTSATLAAPDVAAVKVTVHVAVPGAATVDGEHVKLLI